MALDIKYSKAAKKALDNLDTSTKQRLKDAIENLPSGDVKPLKGSKNLKRMRTGGWRIVFTESNNKIIVTKISPRGDVYKGGLLR